VASRSTGAPVSYAGVESWGRNVAETDEVYIWRVNLSGALVRTLEDMQEIAGAIGRNQRLCLDLRGITVLPVGEKSYKLDAVFTVKKPRLYNPFVSTAEDIAQRVQTELAGRFPGLWVGGAKFEEINDSAPIHHALDFWRYQPVIWDIPPRMWFPLEEEGKPTHAFAKFEGLFRGRAEDGLNLKPWTEPIDKKPPPGTDLPAQPPPSKKEDSTILWLAGGIVAIWLASRVLKEQRS